MNFYKLKTLEAITTIFLVVFDEALALTSVFDEF